MNEDNSWIKLHRKMREWQHYGEPSVVVVFLDLLLGANTKQGWFHGVKIERGQILTSVAHLMENTGLGSNNTVRKALKKLSESGEITLHPTHSYTLITINQFDKYQGCANSAQQDAQPTAQQSAQQDAQPTAHKQEYKNVRNKEISSTSSTRVRETKEYLDDAMQSRWWVEQVCMSNMINEDALARKYSEFLTDMNCRGTTVSTDEADAKSHFQSWLKINLQSERKESGKAAKPRKGSQEELDMAIAERQAALERAMNK